MKTILLTGADGFIGRQTIPFLLERGYEIHAVCHDYSPLPDQKAGLTWHRSDLLDLDEQKRLLTKIKPAYLLHFAWYAAHGKYWTSPENVRWVQGSFNLLSNFTEHGGQRAVMVGTCAEYEAGHGLCAENTTPVKPVSLYGACKHSVHERLEQLSKEKGISSAWGRIFFTYGPYEYPDRLVPTAVTSLLKGRAAEFSHGNQIRDFLFVEDLASAFVSLLESDVQGPVNMASGRPVTLKYIVEWIARQIGRTDLLEFGKRPVPENEPPSLVADISRLSKELGWKPKRTLEEGLQLTIDWWREQLKKAGEIR